MEAAGQAEQVAKAESKQRGGQVVNKKSACLPPQPLNLNLVHDVGEARSSPSPPLNLLVVHDVGEPRSSPSPPSSTSTVCMM